jgi:hypothetical protein
MGTNQSETILTHLRYLQSPIKELPIAIQDAQRLLASHITILKKLALNSQSAREAHLKKLQSKPSTMINRNEIALTTWRTLSYLKDSSSASTLDQLKIPANWPMPFTPWSPLRYYQSQKHRDMAIYHLPIGD